jgi:hypothetical protein
MFRRLVLVFAGALAITGCDLSEVLNPSAVVPAVVVTAAGDSARVEISETVTRGAATPLKFFTFGSCRTIEASRTDVRMVASDTVEVRPYDREGAFPCGGDALKFFPHVVSVTFSGTGRGVIRIVGERGQIAEGPRDQAVVTHLVIIR